MLLFVAQTGREVDRKLERIKHFVSAPGLLLIALLLGFLSIFLGVSFCGRREKRCIHVILIRLVV